MAAFRCGSSFLSKTKRLVLLEAKISPVLSSRTVSSDKTLSDDVEIHTGQKWDKDDYRLARFVETPKQINERFAIDLIDAEPPTPIKDRHVWCNGGGGPLGHPKVYINLDPPGNHICGYCGLRFFQDKGH